MHWGKKKKNHSQEKELTAVSMEKLPFVASQTHGLLHLENHLHGEYFTVWAIPENTFWSAPGRFLFVFKLANNAKARTKTVVSSSFTDKFADFDELN